MFPPPPGGGELLYKGEGCSWEILKRIPRGTKILFCGRDLKHFHPLRGGDMTRFLFVPKRHIRLRPVISIAPYPCLLSQVLSMSSLLGRTNSKTTHTSCINLNGWMNTAVLSIQGLQLPQGTFKWQLTKLMPTRENLLQVQ